MMTTIRESDERIEAALRAAGHPGLAHRFGAYHAKRESDALALRQQAIEALAEDVKALRAFVREVWDATYADTRKPPTIEDVRRVFGETLDSDAIFETCDACGGAGEGVDEILDEFGTQRHRGECPSCIEGRVPR